MTKLHPLCFAAIILSMVATTPETSWGRGFGGMHGGMRGGMRGAGLRGGMGGMRGGMGGMRGGMRGGLGGARMGNLGGRGEFVGRRDLGPGGLGARGGRFPGAASGGFGGNRRTPEMAAGRREAGGLGRGARPGRGQLGNFLGLPSDGGLHAAAGANRLGRDQRGLSRHPNAALRRRGEFTRGGFRGRNFYNRDWYRRYPGAWYPGGWAYGDVWAAADWDMMSDWYGYGDAEPAYYDYGNNVTYQDDSVYMDGQDLGTTDEYYQQAQTLASTGGDAKTTDDEQWMPLGVFAMTHDQHVKANLILQLAVNKDGIIRGNYTATLTDDTKPVQGSVDKKTQRAAWTIGDRTENVFETGVYNLTKDEAPMLVHYGKEKTEQWLLVRLNQDEQQEKNSSQD
jgi:hypothetical protein